MKYFFIFFLTFLCFTLSSQGDASLIEKLAEIVPHQARELVKNEKVLCIKYGDYKEGDDILFNSTLLSRIQKESKLKNAIFDLQALYFFKKGGKDKTKNILKILSSVSELKGLQYYSSSRKKNRLLYKDSYAVSRVEVKKNKFKYTRIKDPIDKIKDGNSIFVLQKDSTFGKNIYEYRYFQEENGTACVIGNVEPIYYYSFKLIEKQEFTTLLLIYDLGDYILIYANTKANIKKVLGIEQKIKNSFLNRLEAVCSWFLEKYNE